MAACSNFNRTPDSHTPEKHPRRRNVWAGLGITALVASAVLAPKGANAFYNLVDKGTIGTSVNTEKSAVSATQIDIQPEKLSCDVTQDYQVNAKVTFELKIGGKTIPRGDLVERTVKYTNAKFGIATCWDEKKGDGTTIETKLVKKGDPFETTLVKIETNNLTSIIKPLERNATTDKGPLTEGIDSSAGIGGAGLELLCQPATLSSRVSIEDCRDLGNWAKKHGQRLDSQANDSADRLVQDALVEKGGKASWSTNIAPVTIKTYKDQAIKKTGKPEAADYVKVIFTKNGKPIDLNDPTATPSFEHQALDSKKYIGPNDPDIHTKLDIAISKPKPYNNQLPTAGATQ